MSRPDAVAAVLLAAAGIYAVFGGADFGAGLWRLVGAGGEPGESRRDRIERSLAPVWEANHVWLIFMLVVLWTGFPEAFAAVMTTLYVPLTIAAIGVVLRGAGFAFGKVIGGKVGERAGLVFAFSSVLTPFAMGTVVGAVASGQVPADGSGDPWSSWIGLLPLLTGALFVASGAYLAAVFLAHDSAAAGEEENARHFGRCALLAAAAAGALAAAGVVVLHRDARFVYDGLTGPGLPLVILSGLCGAAALVLLARGVRAAAPPGRLLRPVAAAAVFAVLAGWGVAQHPYLLPETLTIDDAAAPDPTLSGLLIVSAAAALVVIPALALLYTLQQRQMLDRERQR